MFDRSRRRRCGQWCVRNGRALAAAASLLAACSFETSETVPTPSLTQPVAPGDNPTEPTNPGDNPTEPSVPTASNDVATRHLVFKDRSTGCFHHEALDGSVEIGSASLSSLRATVLASRDKTQFDAAAIGITSERLERERPALLAAIAESKAAGEDGFVGPGPLELGTELTLSYVVNAARADMLGADASTTHAAFEVQIPGEPPLVASSAHGAPWMLPWTIEAGAEKWETYSPDVPRALAGYLPADYPNASLLNGAGYYADRFWSDGQVWGSRLGNILERNATQRVVDTISGLGELRARFSITEASRRGSVPPQLILTLSSLQPSLVDRVRWINDITDGRQAAGWAELQQLHASVERAAKRLGWLQDWKSSKPGRSIRAELSGPRRYTRDRADYFVTPAWKHAGMPGEPSIELSLEDGLRRRTDVFVSESSRVAIVLLADRVLGDGDPASRSHWLDREEVAFHPRSPRYLRVDARGQASRQKIPSDFPALLQALEHDP
jgi:hypothetical protein